MRIFLLGVSTLALVACSGPKPTAPVEAPVETAAPAAAPAEPEVIYAPAGNYTLDKGHASVIWRVKHLGLSKYTARFTDFDAQIVYDPANPAASSVSAAINPASVKTDYPGDYKAGHADSKFATWDEDLAKNPNWFNSVAHPKITFTSTGVSKLTGSTGTITGDLTFLGVTKPVTLDVTYNGTLAKPWMQGLNSVGFSAKTVLKRSDFGMTGGIPQLGDEVEVIIEAEFDEVKG
jgi:polyisoprenoid-binding protein YceI